MPSPVCSCAVSSGTLQQVREEVDAARADLDQATTDLKAAQDKAAKDLAAIEVCMSPSGASRAVTVHRTWRVRFALVG